MRISDWSSDVCSSDLSVTLRANFTSSVTLRLDRADANGITVTGMRGITGINTVNAEVSASFGAEELAGLPIEGRDVIGALIRLPNEIGRASCRDRVCQYV